MKTLFCAGLLALSLGVAPRAGAQVLAPPAPVMPPEGPPHPEPGATPGSRVTTGQAPVVGGNAAGARERALEEAFRQAVDQTINELVDPATRLAQAKTIRAIETKARSYVGRYRTLEEGETNGSYTVRVESEVDRAALQSRLDRGGAPPAPSAPARTAPAIVVAAGESTSAGFAAGVAAGLSAAGIRARAVSAAPLAGPSTTVTATTTDEGPLRGVGRTSVACRGVARFGGLTLPERAASTRAVGDDAAAARAACLDRLAGALATEVAPALTAAAPASDLPVVTIDADVVEPAVVPALLKSVRSVGAVSSADLVRVGGGRAEIRARSRSAPGLIAAALSRDADAMISLSDVQTSGAVIKLRARLHAPPPPETGGTTP
ncbi:MAG TPA: hypothetical protein VKZ18_16425 [Polyangia bacterium]|nr:hypothetical protein [Polyangia bacterium]